MGVVLVAVMEIVAATVPTSASTVSSVQALIFAWRQLDIFAPKADMFTMDKFFLDASNFPAGSNVSMDTENNILQAILPGDTCTTDCHSGAVVINGSSDALYKIDGRDYMKRVVAADWLKMEGESKICDS